jgi:hypothetical protein
MSLEFLGLEKEKESERRLPERKEQEVSASSFKTTTSLITK